MPAMNGIGATREIVASQPGVRVEAMLDAGASSYLLKDGGRRQLIEAIPRQAQPPADRLGEPMQDPTGSQIVSMETAACGRRDTQPVSGFLKWSFRHLPDSGSHHDRGA